MALPSIADQFGEDEVKGELKVVLPFCPSQAQKIMQVVYPSERDSGRASEAKRLKMPGPKNWAREITNLSDLQFISLVVWFRDTFSNEQIEFLREEAARREARGADIHEVWEEIRVCYPFLMHAPHSVSRRRSPLALRRGLSRY